jgi:hypothetical protein
MYSFARRPAGSAGETLEVMDDDRQKRPRKRTSVERVGLWRERPAAIQCWAAIDISGAACTAPQKTEDGRRWTENSKPEGCKPSDGMSSGLALRRATCLGTACPF